VALLILRAIFVMVSVGIAVLIFNSQAVQASATWVPWAILSGMFILPLTVIACDGMIRRKELTTITAVYFGLLIGVFLTYVTMLALQPILPLNNNDPLHTWMPLVVGCILCYICTSILLQTRDDFRFLIPYVEFARDVRGLRPNVLDSSAIVDGRIADLAEAGVFESRFVIPSFVLDDLQAAAESSDRQRRTRGRRGLDVLARLRSNDAIDIDVIAPREEPHDELSMETRVVDLARELGGRIITIEPSATKLAGVRSVPAINVNDVAMALKQTFVVGDAVSVRLIKPGEEPNQGVGFLEDGTMVVVENGRDQIGRTVRASVTSTLQTANGRLVFARIAA